MTWCLNWQPIVVASIEAEKKCFVDIIKGAMWLWRWGYEVIFLGTQPTPLNYNNQSSVKIAKNPIFHAQMKHIEMQYHFVRKSLGWRDRLNSCFD